MCKHHVESNGKDGEGRGMMRLPFLRRVTIPWLMGGLCLLLLAAALVVFLSIYHKGNAAAQRAQDLLTQNKPPIPTTAISHTPAPPSPSPVPDNPAYRVIGTLRIDAIGQRLPILSETTEEALSVSICLYSGTFPGEKGNMVITGHNYASGAHFGDLDRLQGEDAVVFESLDGSVYRYEVYESVIIMPNEVETLDQYEGDCGLTLMTCASQGNRRLLVRCRPVSPSPMPTSEGIAP